MSNNSFLNVLIIDSNQDRRDKIAESFEQIVNIFILSNDKKLKQKTESKRWIEYSEELTFDLCLIHFTDRALKDNYNMIRRIWFAGAEWNEEQLKDIGKEDYFPDPISSTTTISEKCANGIIEYIKGHAKKPRCLLPGIQDQYLNSLAILCQGFLVVNSDNNDQAIKDALNVMGWKEFTQSTPGKSFLEEKDLANKKELVSKPEWWQKPFSMTEEEFTNQILLEWNIDDANNCPLNNLINAIYGTNEIQPTVVAEAFTKLNDKLKD